MSFGRWSKLATLLLAGGVVLQTTTSCSDLIAPLVTNVATSIILNALTGALAT